MFDGGGYASVIKKGLYLRRDSTLFLAFLMYCVTQQEKSRFGGKMSE